MKALGKDDTSKVIRDIYDTTSEDHIHFTDSKNSMASVIDDNGKHLVTTMSLPQVAEQIVVPKLSGKYPWLDRNQAVKLLKFMQCRINEWVKDVPEPDDCTLKNIVYTNKTLTQYYEELSK